MVLTPIFVLKTALISESFPTVENVVGGRRSRHHFIRNMQERKIPGMGLKASDMPGVTLKAEGYLSYKGLYQG